MLKEIIKNKKAVLFDMDGTIINSEEYHQKAIQNIFQKISFDVPDNAHTGICDIQFYQKHSFLKEKLTQSDFINKKTENIISVIQDISTEEFKKYITPNFFNFFDQLKKENIKVALVTASERDVTKEILSKLDLYEKFDLVITRSTTFKSKPSSSPYLNAMRNFKTSTEETLIFEDSKFGLMAAKETGAQVISVNCFTPKVDITIPSIKDFQL